MGRGDVGPSQILDFHGLLAETEFPALMRDVLALLSAAYAYPVDVEFTANFGPDGDFRLNILQCRPLQTRGLGAAVAAPLPTDPGRCLFCIKGNFMGGNVRIQLDFVIYVRPHAYLALSDQQRYAVARHIGKLNSVLSDKAMMLLGPGRWGTTTPALGVPLRFAELCNMAVIGGGVTGGRVLPGALLRQSLLPGPGGVRDLLRSDLRWSGWRELPSGADPGPAEPGGLPVARGCAVRRRDPCRGAVGHGGVLRHPRAGGLVPVMARHRLSAPLARRARGG